MKISFLRTEPVAGQNQLLPAGETVPITLPEKTQLSLGSGDQLIIETPGGGGFGKGGGSI